MRLAFLSLLTFASLATGKPPQSVFADDPPAAKRGDYNSLRKDAITSGAFLVTWIGGQREPIPGALSADAPTFNGLATGQVIISGPWHTLEHAHYATLSRPSRQQIVESLAEAKALWAATQREVSLKASPKGRVWPLPSAGEIADGENFAAVAAPWPKDLPFLDGMTRYKRAGFSQSIAVTNGRDTIDPVHRYDLPNKDWLVSGGMLGIEGFRSDLYRNSIAANPESAIENIGVLNSFGYIQQNRGYVARYANGSRFLDVLSNVKSGSVFEIRQRLKEEGKWKSSVLFSDEKERPAGYAGLTKSCVSCHSQAGTGGYNAGLVPGSDGVLSVGFQDLESRGR